MTCKGGLSAIDLITYLNSWVLHRLLMWPRAGEQELAINKLITPVYGLQLGICVARHITHGYTVYIIYTDGTVFTESLIRLQLFMHFYKLCSGFVTMLKI